MVHDGEQHSPGLEILDQLVDFSAVDIVCPDLGDPETGLRPVVAAENARDAAPVIPDSIGHFLDGSGSVFHLKSEQDAFLSLPGERYQHIEKITPVAKRCNPIVHYGESHEPGVTDVGYVMLDNCGIALEPLALLSNIQYLISKYLLK
jgi:hypothetical protein